MHTKQRLTSITFVIVVLSAMPPLLAEPTTTTKRAQTSLAAKAKQAVVDFFSSKKTLAVGAVAGLAAILYVAKKIIIAQRTFRVNPAFDHLKKECDLYVCEPHHNFCRFRCGHEHCVSCLQQTVDAVFVGVPEDEQSSRTLVCNAPGCKTPAGRPTPISDDITKITSDRTVVTKVNDLLLSEYVKGNPVARWCPTTGCKVFFEQESRALTVHCDGCRQDYCSHCLILHPGETCEEVRARKDERIAERQNEKWEQEHTRPCPNCGQRIEKNGGCNHMICRQVGGVGCGHHFCAVCEGAWAGHTDYFNCHSTKKK